MRLRDQRSSTVPSAPNGVSSRFWELVSREPVADSLVLDVGTGTGRIALAIAPRSRSVVGIDREPDLVEEAQRRAAAASLTNATFMVADADVVEYGSLLDETPRLVTAHLFMSDAAVARSARVLAPGGALAVVAFHVDQWHETGRPSRFAYDEERMRRVLGAHGFAVEHLEVEREVRRFRSVEE